MSQSPADFLRALDRAATPGPIDTITHDAGSGVEGEKAIWTRPDETGRRWTVASRMTEGDARLFIALRTLLPALADVVEAADEVANAGAILSEPQLVTKLRHAVGHLTTAIAREAQSRGGRG